MKLKDHRLPLATLELSQYRYRQDKDQHHQRVRKYYAPREDFSLFYVLPVNTLHQAGKGELFR